MPDWFYFAAFFTVLAGYYIQSYANNRRIENLKAMVALLEKQVAWRDGAMHQQHEMITELLADKEPSDD